MYSALKIAFSDWKKNGVFDQSVLKDFAPGFCYGLKPFPATDLKPCGYTENDTQETLFLERIAEDGILRYTLKLILYKDFPAVEWLPELENTGSVNTDRIQDFYSLAYTLQTDQRDRINILRNLGSKPYDSTGLAYYDDFAPADLVMHQRICRHEVMECLEGRSSADWLPFFGVQIANKVFHHFGIGWSGAWKMTLDLEKDGLFKINCGLRKTDFVLYPGEKIRQSSFFLLEHDPDTDPDDAQNVFRRFMNTHHSARNSKGELLLHPLCFCCGGAIPQKELSAILDYIQAEKYPFEMLWMDAGWYGPDVPAVEEFISADHETETIYDGSTQKDFLKKRRYNQMIGQTLSWWHLYRGYWRVNRYIHPGGLKYYSEKLEKCGIKDFLLWIEIERVMADSPVVQEHPEWLLKSNDPMEKDFVLDLGNPDAVQWMADTVKHLADTEGITSIRVDFNVDTLPFWDNTDTSDRIGITETKFVMGVYNLWDKIREIMPDSIIDNCASGGRRIDFETNSRSIPLHRADGFQTPESQQLLRAGLSRWLPQHSLGSFPVTIGDDYAALSFNTTGSAFSYYLEHMQENPEWLHEICNEVLRLRPLFLQDFYVLTKETWNFKNFHAIQCAMPDHKNGCLLVFRRFGESDSISLALRKIDPAAVYEIEVKNGNKQTVSGDALLKWELTLPQKQSVYLMYYRKLD